MACLYLRKKTYWISYYKDGRKIQKSLKTRDRKSAVYLKNKLENEIAEGKSPLPSSTISLASVYDEFLLTSKQRLTNKGFENYKCLIGQFVRFSGETPISRISNKTLQAFIDKRLTEGVSKSSANHFIKYIKTFMNFAVRQGYILQNPLTISTYKVDSIPPRFLTKAEIKRVLTASTNETLHPLIMTALYTGMRFGELKRLRRDDINFNNNTIMIKKSKSYKFRAIPLHQKLKPVLKNGALPFDLANYRRVFKRIKKKANLNDIGFHTFRHTFASQLVMSGVDIYTVSKLLGHADITTTQIYAHLTHDHVKQSIKQLHF